MVLMVFLFIIFAIVDSLTLERGRLLVRKFNFYTDKRPASVYCSTCAGKYNDFVSGLCVPQSVILFQLLNSGSIPGRLSQTPCWLLNCLPTLWHCLALAPDFPATASEPL